MAGLDRMAVEKWLRPCWWPPPRSDVLSTSETFTQGYDRPAADRPERPVEPHSPSVRSARYRPRHLRQRGVLLHLAEARSVAFQKPGLADQRRPPPISGEDGRVTQIANYGMDGASCSTSFPRTTPTGGRDYNFSQLLRVPGRFRPASWASNSSPTPGCLTVGAMCLPFSLGEKAQSRHLSAAKAR